MAIGLLAAAGTIASFAVVQYASFLQPPDHAGEVTRVIFGNVTFWIKLLFYTSVSAFLITCGFLFADRARNLGRGAAERRRFDRKTAKVRLERLSEGLRMRTLFEDPIAGAMHTAIYVGFLVLFAGTITIEIEDFMPTSMKFLSGNLYLAFSFLLELGGIALIVGICWAIWRRYIQKVYRTRIKTRPEHALILGTLLFIAISGFFVEAFRIAVDGFPAFEQWSFVGYWLGRALVGIFGDGTWVIGIHRLVWFLHFVGFAVFLVILPTTMLRHMITSPMNLYLSDHERPRGAMRPMPNLMEAEIEQIGANVVGDFTWKQLFDTDACTMCGRCTSVCPANITGKPLDPREIVLKVGEVMNATAGFSTTREGELAVAQGEPYEVQAATPPPIGTDKMISISSASVFERVTSEELWSCVTCRACDEICPVDIEIVDKILDIRRYLSLMESDFPTELGNAYRGMENAGNPWQMGQHERTKWADKLDFEVPVIGENVDHIPEYLWWIGCAGSFDDRNVAVTRSIATLLREAGIDYAILGANEMCSGDPARRTGNEFVFQMLALQNIETIGEAGVRKIITQCPHCFNTLKNEYPQYGGDYDVVHHTELLAELLASGNLTLDGEINARVAYHDSCYLGRYNDIFEAPRKILSQISGVDVVEMPRNGTSSFCCGAGGGRMFMEERTGKKIQIERTQEAVATGADTIATACPFCYVMLDDGVKEEGHEDTHRVADVSILMAEALEARMADAAKT